RCGPGETRAAGDGLKGGSSRAPTTTPTPWTPQGTRRRPAEIPARGAVVRTGFSRKWAATWLPLPVRTSNDIEASLIEVVSPVKGFPCRWQGARRRFLGHTTQVIMHGLTELLDHLKLRRHRQGTGQGEHARHLSRLGLRVTRP